MPTGTPLSSVYTLRDIIDRITSRLNEAEPDEARLVPTIIAEVNVQQKALAKKLREEKSEVRDLYIHKYTISGAWDEKGYSEIEATAPVVIEIDRIDCINADTSKWGSITYQPPQAFNNLHGIPYFDNSMIYTTEQKRLKLFVGQNLDITGKTFYIYYVRQANTLSDVNNYMDLPDVNIDELVNMVLQVIQPNKEKENK